MKNYIFNSIILMFSLLLFNSTYSQLQKGLVKYSFSQIQTDASSDSEKIIWNEWMRIWFKDSSLIYELRINYETKESTAKGTIVKKSYPVWRYVYLDLRTMMCQDYQQLKDTAKPFCNYLLKQNDPITIWKFFFNEDIDTVGMSMMPDTSINNIPYKRIKTLYKYYRETGDYYINYLNCKTPKTIFHLARRLDEIFPGYKTTRSDVLNKSKKVIGRTEYKILSSKLSTEEEKIFKQWHKNSKKIQLPLLSYDQAMKSCEAHYEHEKPTITIITNK